jgi:TolB-like protein/Tfp pilus assembly protein PilF
MSGSQGNLSELVSEFRRRRVFRVAAVYAAVAFVALQAVDLVISALHLPAWTFTFLVLLALFGFPLAIILAWAYEITPQGVRRTEPARKRRGEQAAAAPARSPDLIAAGALAMVLVVGGISAYGRMNARLATAEHDVMHRSIAVLPVAHPGDGDAYFSDGIAEDIMTRLSRVEDLRVVSWTSVLAYRDSDKGVRQIGHELGVSHVVEVSVRRDADDVRVRVRLVDARTDENVWANQYDRRLENVFAVQTEIAERVTEALRGRLSPVARQGIEAVPTENMAAYDLLLRGREHYHRHRREENALATALFREAIELDPSFALGHAWLSRAYGANRYRFGEDVVWLDSAEVAARRALALDPGLPDAHEQIGVARFFVGRPREALPYLERAIELDPGSMGAMNALGLAHRYVGRTDEGIRWLRRAIAAAPVAAATPQTNLAAAYLQLELYDRAAKTIRRSLAARPESAIARIVEAWLLLLEGHEEAAVAAVERIAEENRDNARALLGAAEILVTAEELRRAEPLLERAYALSPFVENAIHSAPVLLAYILLKRGEDERARRLMDEFTAHAHGQLAGGSESSRLSYDLAAVHALRGETDNALDRLEEAVRAGWRYYPVAVRDPLLESLRQEPRYREIMAGLAARIEESRRRVEADEA